MDNFLIVAKQVAIFCTLIGMGVACRRLRLLDESAARGVVNILIVLVTPAVVIDSFCRPFDSAMLRQLGLAAVVATAAHFVAIAIACLTFRGNGRTLPVLRDAAVFSNVGFMGIPLEHALLGAQGVFYGTVYLSVFNVFLWSWGLWEMKNAGLRVKNVKSNVITLNMVVNPGTVGIFIGVPVFLFSIPLPEIVSAPLGMMAGLNTPLAMLVIGYYLGGTDLGTFLRIPSVHVVALVRLVVFPLVVLAGLCLIRDSLDRTMSLAVVTAASAPVAAIVTMFAAKYGRDVDMSVGLVSCTTMLSLFTMPMVNALAMCVL